MEGPVWREQDAATGDADVLWRAVSAVPRPMVRQLLLILPMAADLIAAVAWSEPATLGGHYFAGLGLLAFATVVAGAASFRAVPPWVVVVLPVVDLAVIGQMRLVPGGNGLGILCVLPAMWLAADLRFRGAGAAALGTLLLVSVPSLLYFPLTPGKVSPAVLLPTVAVMVALTVAGTVDVWERQSKELSQQGQRLETALADVMANRALNDAIVSTVDVGLAALDRKGRYTAINPRQLEFLAMAHPDGHEGRVDQPGFIYAADRTTPLTRSELPTVRAMVGEEFADQLIWVGQDRARQRALSVSAGPIVDPAGEVDGAVLVYKDITDVMSALKVKDEFVASVSHELRTPLTSIMGFLDLVLDEQDSVTPAVRQSLA